MLLGAPGIATRSKDAKVGYYAAINISCLGSSALESSGSISSLTSCSVAAFPGTYLCAGTYLRPHLSVIFLLTG